MAAPRPKKKTVVKKAPAKDDSFGRFKKMYQGGEVKMLANPPPMPGPAKAATVAKVVSQAAKDLRSTNPKSLRNKALREANRAANQNKPKYKEKIGPNRPQGPEAPKYLEKIGPRKPDSKRPLFRLEGGKLYIRKDAASVIAKSKLVKYGAGGLSAGLMIGGGIGYLTSSSGKKASVSPTTGTGRPEFPSSNKRNLVERTRQSASVSPTTGAGRPEFPSSNKGKKVSGNKSKVGGVGGARALGSSSSSGGSKAAKVGKAKAKVGRQTRYQRNELAMEQRKRSSGKPKKSIFSLFRKG